MKALWIYWIRVDNEVELTDEEFSDDEDDIAEVFRIDTNIFDYETPLCLTFKEFNYLLEGAAVVLMMILLVDRRWVDGGDDDGVLVVEVFIWFKEGCITYGKVVSVGTSRGFPTAATITSNTIQMVTGLFPQSVAPQTVRVARTRNGAAVVLMMILLVDRRWVDGGDDDGVLVVELERRWNTYTSYDDAYEINHEHNKSEELCEVHELPVSNIKRYMMIKYSFNGDEEYVAVKEDEYDDLTVTRKEAFRAYQEIFQIMDERWMVTRAE
ncbi:hypothetical protein Tco_0286659 [Tanacetum coccineum]